MREIKADPALRHLPVVMLTTSLRDEDIRRAYRDGACTCISKLDGLDKIGDFARRFEAGVARISG